MIADDVRKLVADIATQVAAPSDQSVPGLRKIRRKLSERLRSAEPGHVLDIVSGLIASPAVPRWFAYELLHHHAGAMSRLTLAHVERLGSGMSSWGDVDSFGCLVTGPAWREGALKTRDIQRWARSPDRWWRRCALVSTVPLNITARGGSGDAGRTFAVCDLLKAQHRIEASRPSVERISTARPMSRVLVIDYDPGWPELFERVRSHVWQGVSHVASSVEHVGSTAVPGLMAKPIVDVCVIVESRDDIPASIDGLAGIGYVHWGNLGVPDREAFHHHPADLPRHHLYLSPRDSLSLRNHLGLRDYLRSHPVVAREYGDLKASLARRFPEDIDSYIAGKTEFILGILRQVGLTEDELAEIRGINPMANR